MFSEIFYLRSLLDTDMEEFSFDAGSEDATFTEYDVFESHFNTAFEECFNESDVVIEYENATWKKYSGTKVESYDSGSEFLRDILPDGDIAVDVRVDEDSIFVKVYTHDTPIGATFEIRPVVS